MTLTSRILRRDETLVIDGQTVCKFERCYLGTSLAIIIDHPKLNRKVVITGDVLAGFNGWLARLAKETKEATKH